MNKTMLGSLFLAAALIATASADETLAQKHAHQPQMDTINGHLKGTNEACGTSITATVEWDGFDKVDLTKASKSGGQVAVGQWCGNAIEAVDDVCHQMKDDGKKAVKSKIHKVVCRYGGEGKRAISLADGTFTYTMDFKVAEGTTEIRQDLMKKL